MPSRFELPSQPYTKHEIKAAILTALGAVVAHAASIWFLPPESLIYPAGAVALAGLFFGGLRVWPAPFLAILVASIAAQTPLPLVYLLPFALTVQAAIGAYLLRKAGIDPLFRRYRDSFYVLLAILIVSVVTPLILLLVPDTGRSLTFTQGYVATIFSLLVVTPFLLRWSAKLRFKRPLGEAIETLLIILTLIGLNAALFVYGITEVAGVFTVYFLLIPLFWAAIRLRPRWVTFGILVTSGFTLYQAVTGSSPGTLATELFAAEMFMIVIATVFYVIVSLEEDRRANTNLVRSQLQTLENAVSRISSESQAKNDFIAILAHELRNPLSPVVSAIELMKLKPNRDHDEAETLEIMETSMQTVRRLLDDMLDISRISEGKVSIKHEVVDVSHSVRRAVVSTALQYKERHQTLTLIGSKEPLYVDGDSVRLEQIFSNLLTNASKYTPSGGSITLTVAREGDQAVVSVQDEGIGIPPDALDTIFLPFHQLDRGTRSKKGLGIGLALVHSFVDMHGGTITAESEGEDKGSTFTVRLPLSEGEPEKPGTPKSRTELPKAKNGVQILVVDDNDAAAAGIGRLLEMRGCSVTYAYDGTQAIQAAEKDNPTIILLDIGLPDLDGYTVAKTLRTQGFTGTLVALSGFSTPDARERGKAAGFDHYLVKPAGISELKKVIPGLK